jgi:anti-sigma-K factor RskA
MVPDEHSRLRENIPAYALGALDAEDVTALEAHIQTCDSCQTELASYREMTDSLLAAVPPRDPSPALRKRLQGRLPSAQSVRKVSPPRFVPSFGKVALGSALVILLAINLFSFSQLRELQRQQASLLQQVQNSQAALAMLSYPGTRAVLISEGNISGTVLLDRDRNTAALVAWNLPELSPEQIYQVWLIEPDGHRVSAGLFRPQAGSPYTTQPVSWNGDISAFVGLGVTVEPAGGSDQPTGPRVFKVDF